MTKPRAFILIAVLAAAAGAFALWQQRSPEGSAHSHPAGDKYQCPMHPQIVRDEPGDCPICHMALQKVDNEMAEPAKEVERHIVKYRNPMDPKVFSNKPMKDPMGMDYIPVYSDELGQDDPSAVSDHAAFSLSAERRQLIGVRSVQARRQAVVKTLRLPGRVGDQRSQVLAQALEMDGGVLKPGLNAQVLVREGLPKRARVVQVDRSLDSFSRTFGVVLSLLDSPDPRMRPGVYVAVSVELRLAEGVAVPKEAVLDTGERKLLFVQKDGGRFEPRDVQVGVEGDSLIEIRRGVVEGERVVTSANFLIDSESRFQSAAQAFSGGQP